MTNDAPKPLGPGDDDPRSPAITATAPPAVVTALGPGDDDPRSPAKGTPLTIAGPLGPGDATSDDDGEDLVMLAPAPPGPGDAASGPRHVTHVPRRKPTMVVAAVEASMSAVALESDPDAVVHGLQET